jgi:hypothetical protein
MAYIPDAPFYVLTEDSFMSGWGPAKNKVNVLILPCETYTEACIVADNARNRSDQKRVRINTTKPRVRPHWYISVHDKGSYSRWYEPGAFKKGQ